MLRPKSEPVWPSGKARFKRTKGSKERYLLGQNTTPKIRVLCFDLMNSILFEPVFESCFISLVVILVSDFVFSTPSW